jgi:hypothetical protein
MKCQNDMEILASCPEKGHDEKRQTKDLTESVWPTRRKKFDVDWTLLPGQRNLPTHYRRIIHVPGHSSGPDN